MTLTLNSIMWGGQMSMDEERKRVIADFFHLMNTVQDDRRDVLKVMDFLIMITRTKRNFAPISEFVSVLKHQKPVLFGHVKKAVSPTSPLYFVIQLDMKVEDAMARLQQYSETK